MKQLFILFILLISPLYLFSQVGFGYDAAGNRETRYEIVISPKSAEDIENSEPQEFEIDQNYSLRLFPNPTSGLINFSVQGPENDKDLIIKLKIYSVNGSVVQVNTYSTDHFIIDITNEPNGVYLLDLFLNKKPKHFIIIKK